MDRLLRTFPGLSPRRLSRLAVAGLFALLVFAGPTLAAQRPSLAMLDMLQPGQWEVRDRDLAGGRSRICIESGRRLIQIRHMREACRSFTVQDTADAVTVHYTCPGNGYGQTSVRYESAQLVQLETQGIAQGLPFNFRAEVRRVGTCTS
ncbi:hypothetical protein NSE01_15180 [Novosphingobium sediminis]|uniref:DUF3617 family protein n=1 Tax=Novosphingobium sediminis TaxID=707214 RepID=A0A512AIZ4_9SPHN|nr:DUF3617 domain-containing protein [Novosphingobium sediminis]GEN99685.1 hypothetical protein NSE01_15180 [Novosphingobium sediminis]